ncbi:hypothetical protein [Aeromonas sp. SG16]|uniref:hypothetical protein n=1 Tax=Aeromonas sp. SG16 TaxID=2950548 RepID=UPI00210B3E7B|nr:hypothetical protein [Aeromonas sp. SG16]MCQ4054446.1 hypothetical protein [Aeromonas sp. SG16]
MTSLNQLFSQLKNHIDANTLMTNAREMLSRYTGKIWTDTATHDPGITLLEAISYGVSDIAYRHTRSLIDLLTPCPDKQISGEGLFPVEFGPEQALTCGPVTRDDYRRAILDLHSTHSSDGYFFFTNVFMDKEPESSQYQYWYDVERREFHFIGSDDPDVVKEKITLLGNYHLYVIPSPEAEKNPSVAKKALDDFLSQNRNLGEAVSDIIWFQPEDIYPQIVVDLEDDVGTHSNVAAILANIYRVVQDYISPQVIRKTTAQLFADGLRSEDIYQGPFLQHGWIPNLPPEIDMLKPQKVNLSGLVSCLLDIEGIKGVRHLSTESGLKNSWQWEASHCGYYPRLWGANPLEKLADGITVQLLAKGDILFTAGIDEIKKELKPSAIMYNQPDVLQYGQWRDPGRVYPVSNLIPPCYELMVPAATLQQEHLHQFMLMFEQMLADNCQQLAMLPTLLSFKQQGDLVWGREWPFANKSISDEVHSDYREDLKNLLTKSQFDRSKALAITEFMLGYFNAQLAPDVFSQPPASFLASQQGYLSRQAELVYHRANSTYGKVSSLQRRIAARLGLGGSAIFYDNVSLDNLPFYLVEHRALLPKQPNEKYVSPQSINRVYIETIDGQECLEIATLDVIHLKVGMVLDLIIDFEGSNSFVIRSQVVTAVDYNKNSFSFTISASASLKRNLDEILSSTPDSLAWLNSDVWLEEMNYRLVYAADQSGLVEGQKRLTCGSFPVMLEAADELLLEYRIGAHSGHVAYHGDVQQQLTVVSVDRIANTLVVSSKKSLPSDQYASSYVWYLPSSYSTKDRFSFMVSAVFNQDLLVNSSSEPYATESWVREVILAEIPSHLGMLLHWKPKNEFSQFAKTYSEWQSNKAILGDRSYDLMKHLALGQLPDALEGIGSMHIATSQQKEWVVGADGNEWNSDLITNEELFYVPSLADKEDINKS